MKILKKNQTPTTQCEKVVEDIKNLSMEIDRLTILLNEKKDLLKEEMMKEEMEEFSCNHVNFKIRQPYTRITKKVNYKEMKKHGLYNKYVTETETYVNASIVVKYEDEE